MRSQGFSALEAARGDAIIPASIPIAMVSLRSAEHGEADGTQPTRSE